MRKRIVSALLALCMALTMLPVSAWAAEQTGTWGALSWKYDDDTGTLTISGTGDIPDRDAANPPDYDQRRHVQHIVIESGVTGIGQSAFNDYVNLASVTIADTVTTIGESAFADCGNLTSVTFEGNVGSIGNSAFNECQKLTSVTFDGSVGSIGNKAFSWCKGLTSLVLPEGLTSVGTEAFSYCKNLIRVYLPKTVQTIGTDPFIGCDELRDVYFGGREQEWKNMGGSETILAGLSTVPICHPDAADASGCSPDTEAGDLPTLLKRIEDGVGVGRTDIELTADLTLSETLIIPEDCNIILDLKGNKITSSASPAIEMLGNLTVWDSTSVGATPVVGANNSVSYTSGSIESTTGNAVYVQPGRTLRLLNGTIKAAGRAVTVYADRNEGNNTYCKTIFEMDSGYVEAEDSAVMASGFGAEVTINGGVLLSKNAPVISGDEEKQGDDTGISIEEATLIARRPTNGTLSCGIYHPQRGSLSLRGVVIHAEDGVGILMRGGSVSLYDGFPEAGTATRTATCIYADGSGQGSIGTGGVPLSAGQRIVMDQKSGFDNSNAIHVKLYQDLQHKDELTPSACHADGFGVRVTSVSSGGSNYDEYTIERGYTVKFDANGGSGSTERLSDIDGKIEWPADPVREGYVFRGWSGSMHDNAFRDIIDRETTIFNRDTILCAVWVPKGAYVVSFWTRGDAQWVFDTKVTGIGGVLQDWPLYVPTSPFDGHVFTGWFADPNGGVEYPFDQPFTKDTILYAHWDDPKGPHTITFHRNDGTGGIIAQKPTDSQGELTDWPVDPTRDKHVFLGWSWSEHYSIGLNNTYVFYRDTDIYARWVPEDGYVITFDPKNGGSIETRHTNHTKQDTTLARSEWPNPVLEGWTFGGWYDSPNPPNGVRVEFDTMFPGDTSLYAYWIKNGGGHEPGKQTYTITFDPNGGVGGGALTTGTNGRLSSLLANPTYTGHTFKGWYTAKSGGTEVTTSTVFTADTTVYAQWTDGSPSGDDTSKTYTITFDPNGGVGGGALTTGTNGRLSSLPANPIYTGYIFNGWYTALSGGARVTTSTVFTADTTVYAHWSLSSGTSSSTNVYQIYMPGNVSGGSLFVSQNSATEGTLITVEVSPWNNYALSYLSAVRVDTGWALNLTGRYNYQYTFIMPASDVRLGAAFASTYVNSSGYSYNETPVNNRPVKWYYRNGGIYHVVNGPVSPAGPFTRDMLVSILYNMDANSFGDPTVWAAANNIVPDIYATWIWGGDKYISREQTAAILYCYAQHMGYNTTRRASLAGYVDSGQIRSSARAAMSWSQAAGLITGASSNTLSPQAIVTCEEASIILSRFLSNVAGTW